MNDIRKKALDKMLEEMNKSHTGAEDAIHNWLCNKTDEKLLEGVLKEGRTINGAMKYCSSEAAKQKSGNVAMVDDATVFGWVKKYFISKNIPKSSAKVSAKVVTSDSVPKMKKEEFEKNVSAIANKRAGTPVKVKSKIEKNNSDGVEQLSLLDML